MRSGTASKKKQSILSLLLVSGLISYASADGASNLFERLKDKRVDTIQKAEDIFN